MKYKTHITFIIIKSLLKTAISFKKKKDKYLLFCCVICQDVKELIKHFEPGEVAEERQRNTRNVSMQVKSLTEGLTQTKTFQVFSTF